MVLAEDDDQEEVVDYDPRWEVQPELEPDDEPGSNMRAVLIAAAAVTAIVLVLAWLLANAQPAF